MTEKQTLLFYLEMILKAVGVKMPRSKEALAGYSEPPLEEAMDWMRDLGKDFFNEGFSSGYHKACDDLRPVKKEKKPKKGKQ